jgi:hypothetical protein
MNGSAKLAGDRIQVVVKESAIRICAAIEPS